VLRASGVEAEAQLRPDGRRSLTAGLVPGRNLDIRPVTTEACGCRCPRASSGAGASRGGNAQRRRLATAPGERPDRLAHRTTIPRAD